MEYHFPHRHQPLIFVRLLLQVLYRPGEDPLAAGGECRHAESRSIGGVVHASTACPNSRVAVCRTGGSHHAVTPLVQGFAQVRGELAFPLPHGFMRKDEAPLEEHLRQVPQAQFVAETPSQGGVYRLSFGKPRWSES
jgi:hypothetical protein